jgi:6-carboxyhexanoate--CoA ligase
VFFVQFFEYNLSVMKKPVSIRMRASKLCKVKNARPGESPGATKLKTQNNNISEIHISGAEGIYESSETFEIVKKYIQRALRHPKGEADRIVITIEDIQEKPESISSLPVSTVTCNSPIEGRKIIKKLLHSIGVSNKAVNTALSILSKGAMRGAAIITAERGLRLEPDRERGIRASRFGISKPALRWIEANLSRFGINTDTVREAVILASKVAASREVIAELCMSDDPDYTTGYVASQRFGYVRVPNIKSAENRSGGRAFFIMEAADVERITDYLERTPVIIDSISPCRGVTGIDEIIDCINK